MKQKLLLMLKTLFASKGFSQKALEGLADFAIAQGNLIEESTAEDMTAAIEMVKPMTDIMQSEINRQVNANPKPADPKPATEPVVPVVIEGETAEQKSLRLILEKLDKQDATIAAMQGEKVANTRREQYVKALEGTSEAYKTEALKDFDLLNFKDDEHYSSWLAGKTESVKDFVQDETNKGLGIDRPQGGAGGNAGAVGKASEAELDAVMENL